MNRPKDFVRSREVIVGGEKVYPAFVNKSGAL